MERFGLDDTSGQVVGGPAMVGQLYYEGRPQGPRLYGDYEPDLVEQATALKGELEQKHPRTYQNAGAWSLHIPVDRRFEGGDAAGGE